MKAFILAAGLGTRLKNLTKDLPKPLIKVKGKSLLEWNILKLKTAGIDHIIINTHYLGSRIEEAIGDGKKFNIKVPSLVTHPRDIWGIATPPAVPATYFINPNGEIAVSLFRPQTKDSLNTIYIELKNTI